MLKQLPNAITASRGLAGPLVAVLVLRDQHEAAFAVFIAAILTDLVDGMVARALQAESTVGRWLDPISDKLLMNFSWAAMWWAGWAPWWLALPMLLRDASVVGLGVWLAWTKTPWSPNMAGRLAVSYSGVAVPVLLFRHPWLDVHWPTVGVVTGLISLALSVVAAVIIARDIRATVHESARL